ncbi:MAG TPA: FAD synthetase family protein [Chondromyces sp.]|nr:FAD synthetase family protein [Chondromyces sp.]
METIYLNPTNLEDYQRKADPCVIALGFFDGVHIGHRQVIKTAKRAAKEGEVSLAVMSFFPHPKAVLSKGKKKVDYLLPLKEKQRILSRLGVDRFYIVQFDPEFASLSPQQFVNKYLLQLGAVHVVAGFDYAYGCRGEGNMDRMKKDSGGILDVTKVEKVELDGEKISSTLVREKIRAGEIDRLPAYLGDTYHVEGRILLRQNTPLVLMKPYYLLPARGKYEVTVKSKLGWSTTEAFVTGEPGLIFLPNVAKGSVVPQEYVQIEWKRCLSKELCSNYYQSEKDALSTG